MSSYLSNLETSYCSALPAGYAFTAVLWPLLTSDSLVTHHCVGCRFTNSWSRLSCQISPGKNAYFHSIYLLHLHRMLRIVWGFTLFSKFTQQYVCLLCSSYSSDRSFAADFLQIPPLGGHPCLRLTVGTINPRIGLSPTSKRPCWAQSSKRLPIN
jgi:hypothetical protein